MKVCAQAVTVGFTGPISSRKSVAVRFKRKRFCMRIPNTSWPWANQPARETDNFNLLYTLLSSNVPDQIQRSEVAGHHSLHGFEVVRKAGYLQVFLAKPELFRFLFNLLRYRQVCDGHLPEAKKIELLNALVQLKVFKHTARPDATVPILLSEIGATNDSSPHP